MLSVAAIVAYTTSGATATRIARERPASRILSLAPDQAVARQLALTWGACPLHVDDEDNIEDMVTKATAAAHRVDVAPPQTDTDRSRCPVRHAWHQRSSKNRLLS